MIELMKFDMGGCAAVFGAAKAIAQLRPEVRVWMCDEEGLSSQTCCVSLCTISSLDQSMLNSWI